MIYINQKYFGLILTFQNDGVCIMPCALLFSLILFHSSVTKLYVHTNLQMLFKSNNILINDDRYNTLDYLHVPPPTCSTMTWKHLMSFTALNLICASQNLQWLHTIHSLNFHSCRHIGQGWWTCWEFSHLTIQWMWKQWEHWPHTEKYKKICLKYNFEANTI